MYTILLISWFCAKVEELVHFKLRIIRLRKYVYLKDKRIPCVVDVDYQVSTDGLSAHWFVPDIHKTYTPDVYWTIEQRAPIVSKFFFSVKPQHVYILTIATE